MPPRRTSGRTPLRRTPLRRPVIRVKPLGGRIVATEPGRTAGPATMRGRGSPARLSALLLTIAAIEIIAMFVLYAFFVRSQLGQRLDYTALASDTIGAGWLGRPVASVLNVIDIAAVVTATVIVAFIAVIRRRYALAATTIVFIGGVIASAEGLKHVLTRPDLGIDEARALAGNSFPSGHTAVAAAAVVALVLVLPPRLRGAGAVVGAIYAAAVGVATLSAGWHRPSDAVAAFLLVGVWAALAGVLLRVLRRGDERVAFTESHRTAGLVLGAAGTVMLVFALVCLLITDGFGDQPFDALSQGDRMIAYGGSAAGVLAASLLTLAIVLTTVHRIVPRRSQGASSSGVRAPASGGPSQP